MTRCLQTPDLTITPDIDGISRELWRFEWRDIQDGKAYSAGAENDGKHLVAEISFKHKYKHKENTIIINC